MNYKETVLKKKNLKNKCVWKGRAFVAILKPYKILFKN